MPRQEAPGWVPDVSKYKNNLSRIALRTFNGGFTTPARGQWVAEVLEDFITTDNRSKINYLEVGIGGFSGVVGCAFEPYHIAGVFEQYAVDYSGLIVDRSRTVLDNFVGRTRLFQSPLLASIYELDPESMKEGWDSYLERTKQKKEVINRDHPQLVINDFDFFPFSRVLLKRLALYKGIDVAKVSPVFTEKLRNSQVSVLQADITGVNLVPYGPFDVGVCMNVLYYLNSDGQKIAINNMVSNIASGGMFIYNDSRTYPILAEHGGWLDSDKQQDLGLSIAKSTSHGKSSGHSVVLKKG